ncbi:ABC transporter ATP-binding protein [Lutibacter flavus]|uniref:Peptide/nickel transport system ATP-binding protein n=1 Tax=Lutibacter flavus TaxID=691689 RepID=A0A238WY80_9FLAO|nr:ABC transporter ATP-binding protein [Lutibacter flavus]SNR51506.1 peptide/nickel transport system ATP-binding protein [Lutibacter flavus]
MLIVKNLSVSFKSDNVINNISYCLNKNEILGIVGESGSGKSVSSLAILGLLPKKQTNITGEILFEDKNLIFLNDMQFREIRGNKISMIFQEPMSSLNPSLTCGFQVLEILLQHKKISKSDAKKQVIELFNKVKLPRAETIFNQYPHQLSGGQKQRVMIAMAIACKPKILIADEPTTALDVTVQKEIIELLKELQKETEMSIIFITHDLGLVSEIADNVLVMYQGKIVEQGNAKELFKKPKHNYTKALINSKPRLGERLKKLPTVQDFINETEESEIYSTKQREEFHSKIYIKKPLLEVKNISTYFKSDGNFFFGKPTIVKAVDGVSFQLFEGETLGLVGESGCGKTTLGRTILHLEKATKGEFFYKQKDVTQLSKKELKEFRREVQIIFQDPFSSLNPRIPVGNAIMEPMKVHGILKSTSERKSYVFDILKRVGLEEEHFYRYPHEFSGGQRQRIGIARTIALRPKLIICDESVSALDVSVQAQVLNLLNELKIDFGFTYIFISHDLSVVKYMADQLVVMNKGKIEEVGDADEVYKNPKTEYTQKLIDAIPKGI